MVTYINALGAPFDAPLETPATLIDDSMISHGEGIGIGLRVE